MNWEKYKPKKKKGLKKYLSMQTIPEGGSALASTAFAMPFLVPSPGAQHPTYQANDLTISRQKFTFHNSDLAVFPPEDKHWEFSESEDGDSGIYRRSSFGSFSSSGSK